MYVLTSLLLRYSLSACCLARTVFSRSALNYADVLLNEPLGISQLDDIWGSGGGCRPLKLLVKKVTVCVHTCTYVLTHTHTHRLIVSSYSCCTLIIIHTRHHCCIIS